MPWCNAETAILLFWELWLITVKNTNATWWILNMYWADKHIHHHCCLNGIHHVQCYLFWSSQTCSLERKAAQGFMHCQLAHESFTQKWKLTCTCIFQFPQHIKNHLPGNKVLGLKQGIAFDFPWKINKNLSCFSLWRENSNNVNALWLKQTRHIIGHAIYFVKACQTILKAIKPMLLYIYPGIHAGLKLIYLFISRFQCRLSWLMAIRGDLQPRNEVCILITIHRSLHWFGQNGNAETVPKRCQKRRRTRTRTSASSAHNAWIFTAISGLPREGIFWTSAQCQRSEWGHGTLGGFWTEGKKLDGMPDLALWRLRAHFFKLKH